MPVEGERESIVVSDAIVCLCRRVCAFAVVLVRRPSLFIIPVPPLSPHLPGSLYVHQANSKCTRLVAKRTIFRNGCGMICHPKEVGALRRVIIAIASKPVREV